MAHPFVFHFTPGDEQGVEIMYITDLDCACGVCGHPQIQRFYHSHPFHPLTLTGFERLASSCHEKAGYECENCGADVGSADVARGVVRYAFADDAGELSCFVEGFGGVDGVTTRYQLRSDWRLDPQVQPTFVPDETREVYDALDDALLEAVLGRPFNLKRAIIEFVLDALDDASPGAWAELAPGMMIVSEASDDELDALVEEVEASSAEIPDDLVWFPLLGPSRAPSWLPGEISEELGSASDLVIEVGASQALAVEVLEDAFEVARLEWSRAERGEELFFVELTTPRGSVYDGEVSITSVLERSVREGISPGESARLTAEEIVGTLLRVWA